MNDVQHTYTSSRSAAIVQARLGSVRFPRKVLQPIGGTPALELLLRRLSLAESIDMICLAIPDSARDDELEAFAQAHGILCARGSEVDVLDRYRQAVDLLDLCDEDVVVRITADCPFLDPAVVDIVTGRLDDPSIDFASTGVTYPDGLDVQAVRVRWLRRAARESTHIDDREHVLPYVIRHREVNSVVCDYHSDLGDVRLTLDEPEDLTVLQAVGDKLGTEALRLADIVELLETTPQTFAANRHLARNEGGSMGTGQKLWRHAKQRIPGGSMLLSKRAEMLLPDEWPAYFSRAEGCRVWDLDRKEFIDVGLMGVGTNILGYGHPKVDEAVRQVIDKGNLSTLNAPEEVELADRLCALHPWSDMVRFTRSGGEACAVAVRIARAASGKDAVAFCGYHGWHDWYLAANLADDAALDGHLLPGLQPKGVPRALTGSARPFRYNEIDELRSIMADGDVGVIIMEVERSTSPAPGFLEEVRQLATQRGAVLIFDECTSGFRRVLGGLHLHYGVEPDIAIFGKTLGNGYAVNAIVGRASVMVAAEQTFISSTFWTERIGAAAGLAALDVMAEEDAPAQVFAIGSRVEDIWREAGASVGLDVRTSGGGIAKWELGGVQQREIRTFVTRYLLKQGFLGSTSLYACIAHDEGVLDRYAELAEDMFVRLGSALESGHWECQIGQSSVEEEFRRLA